MYALRTGEPVLPVPKDLLTDGGQVPVYQREKGLTIDRLAILMATECKGLLCSTPDHLS